MSFVNKVLLSVAALLFVIIVACTAVALFAKNVVPGAGLRRIDPSPRSVVAGSTAFTLIGQLRTTSRTDDGGEHCIVIVDPWLEYAGGDTDFYEELDRKQRALRAAISAYFTQFTEEELVRRGERAVKDDLLSLINAQLVLGKVSAIYFNEYQFLD